MPANRKCDNTSRISLPVVAANQDPAFMEDVNMTLAPPGVEYKSADSLNVTQAGCTDQGLEMTSVYLFLVGIVTSRIGQFYFLFDFNFKWSTIKFCANARWALMHCFPSVCHYTKSH